MEMVSSEGLQCTICPSADGDVMESKENSQETKGKATKKDKKDEADKEDMAWICAECKEAECGLVGADDEDVSGKFLICDGPCQRIFHIPCAGLTKAPAGDDDWLCQDCSRKEHACAYCSEYGQDYVDVFPCKDDSCGLFFHEACLRLHNVDYKYAPSPISSSKEKKAGSDHSSDDDEDEQDEGSKIPVFTCHAHQCWCCTQKDMIQLEKNERALQQKNNNKKSRKKRKKNTSIFQSKPGRLYVSFKILDVSPHKK